MKLLSHSLAGEAVHIYFYEDGDLPAFRKWLEEPRQIVGFDTETTGLDIYSRDFACRLAQFGDEYSSWVIPARYVDAITLGIRSSRVLAMHNANHDLHVLDRCFGLKLEEVHPKTIDTYILSHIHDPRGKEEGGLGHGLKQLADQLIDPECSSVGKHLKEVFAANKWTIADGWSQIEEGAESFVRYAGLDPIETVRLFNHFWPLVTNKALVDFEHRLQRVLARMERRGFLLDVSYSTKLLHHFDQIVDENETQLVQMFKELGTAKLTPRAQRIVADSLAIAFGQVPPKRRQSNGKLYEPMSAGSNQIVVASLLEMGEPLTLRTATGNLSVDKDVLNALCDVNKDDERLFVRGVNPLARLVKDAKRAGKWKSSYIETMLEIRDDQDRVHAKINGLQARTGRMSISRPPFQQLPSSGRVIRDCLISDPGNVLFACDYEQVEMRLLAAMANEPKMKEAIATGTDLHDMTATILFGPDFTNKQRKAAKNAGFGKVYGGGAGTLAKQVGVTESQAREVITSYDEAFPGVREYGKELERMARNNDNCVITPMYGRRLPLDEHRLYAATNYMIQSTARDIFGEALLRLDKGGLGEYINLPVHDEVIGQAPKAEVADIAKAVGETMTTTFDGVLLAAEGEIVGTRWGDKYGDTK